MDIVVKSPKSDPRIGVSRSVRVSRDRGARFLAQQREESVSDIYDKALKVYLEKELGPFWSQHVESVYAEEVA